MAVSGQDMGRSFPLGGEDLPAKAMLPAAREVSRWLDTFEFRYNEEQNDQLNTNKDGNFCILKRQGLQPHVIFAQAPQFGSQFSWEPLPRVGGRGQQGRY